MPSLLELLGLDEQTLSWHQLAACNNMDISLFFEKYETNTQIAKSMDELCLSCPVLKDCLMEAQDNKDDGLRGAIYLDNGKPDRQRNEHKTPEVWQRIKERLQ